MAPPQGLSITCIYPLSNYRNFQPTTLAMRTKDKNLRIMKFWSEVDLEIILIPPPHFPDTELIPREEK